MKKRILSLILVLVMLIGLVPEMGISASATTYSSTAYIENANKLSAGDVLRAGATIGNEAGFDVWIYESTSKTDENPVIRLEIMGAFDEGWTTDKDYYVVFMEYDRGNRSVDLYLYPLSSSVIKLHPNGGKFSDSSTNFKTVTALQETDDNSNVSKHTPTKKGYTFLGWYTGDFSEQVYDANGKAVSGTYWKNNLWQGAGDKDFTAEWQPNTYTVNFNANGGNVSTPSRTVTYDSPYGTLPTPTRTGYTFNGWYTDAVNGTKVESSTNVAITSAQTLYAHWDKTTYTVSKGTSANGSLTITPTTATMDETVSVSIAPQAGWAVDTVNVNGAAATKTAENQYSFSMPAANAVVNVTYRKIPYTVTLLHDGTAAGGSFSVDMSTATVGDTVTITVETNLGYFIEVVTFNGFAATDNGNGTYCFTMPAQNVSVLVTFDVDLPAIAKELQLLNDADDALQQAIANRDAALDQKITDLTTALNNAKAALEAADTANKDELNTAITNAQTTLQAAIDQVQGNLNAVESRLDKAIEDLDKAMKAGDKDLADKINALNTTLTSAKAALEKADADNKAELVKKIEDADKVLDDAIKAVQKNLDDAKAELNKAIADGDTALDTKIADLNTALEAAKAALEAADAANKAALENEIQSANALIDSLDIRVTDTETAIKKLENAISVLKSVDAANAKALEAAIKNLNAAVDAAEEAAEAGDKDLAEKLAEAQTALSEKINDVRTNLDNAKAELQEKIDTKADTAEVNAAVANLQSAIGALEAVKDHYMDADDALRSELEAVIEKAKQEAIAAAKGHIPYIGENGNWWIGDTDTGVNANGIAPKLRINNNIWEVSYDGGKTWESMGIRAVGASGTNGRNGKDGKDGKDGADGKDGKDGKDGITPKLQINSQTNMWEVSYDNGKTWESLGVNATGAAGKDGADGKNGVDGKDGSAALPVIISGISLAGMVAMFVIMMIDRKKRAFAGKP